LVECCIWSAINNGEASISKQLQKFIVEVGFEFAADWLFPHDLLLRLRDYYLDMRAQLFPQLFRSLLSVVLRMESHVFLVAHPPFLHFLHGSHPFACFGSPAEFAVGLLTFRPAPASEIVGPECLVELLEIWLLRIGAFAGIFVEEGVGGAVGSEMLVVRAFLDRYFGQCVPDGILFGRRRRPFHSISNINIILEPPSKILPITHSATFHGKGCGSFFVLLSGKNEFLAGSKFRSKFVFRNI